MTELEQLLQQELEKEKQHSAEIEQSFIQKLKEVCNMPEAEKAEDEDEENKIMKALESLKLELTSQQESIKEWQMSIEERLESLEMIDNHLFQVQDDLERLLRLKGLQ